jgi:hypothetical protein
MFASYLLDLIRNTRATDRAKVSIAQSVGTGIRENATMLSEKLHRVDGKSPMANAELTRSANEIAVGTDSFQPADRVTDFDRLSQRRFAEVSAAVRIRCSNLDILHRRDNADSLAHVVILLSVRPTRRRDFGE